MKKILLGTGLLALALVIRVVPTGKIGLAWTIDRDTHRAISFNELIFWILLLVLGAWAIVELALSLRRNLAA
jgi:hypothetical protein